MSLPVVGEFNFLFGYTSLVFFFKPINLCVGNFIGLLPKAINNKYKYPHTEKSYRWFRVANCGTSLPPLLFKT